MFSWRLALFFYSSSWLENKPFSKCANPDLPFYHKVTIQILAYVAVHTFALRLIYPGSVGIIQKMLCEFLIIFYNLSMTAGIV